MFLTKIVYISEKYDIYKIKTGWKSNHGFRKYKLTDNASNENIRK